MTPYSEVTLSGWHPRIPPVMFPSRKLALKYSLPEAFPVSYLWEAQIKFPSIACGPEDDRTLLPASASC